VSDGTSTLLNATYVSSSEADKILTRLTKAAGFTTDNIISRLAIARSLAEGPLTPAADWEPARRGGKQIKGYTLLGRQEVANSLLAMAIEASGESMTVEELRHHIRLRWEHGLRLIDREVRGSDMEAVLLSYTEKAVLADSRTPQRSSMSPLKAVSDLLVGQLPAKRLLEEMLDRAIEAEPPALPKPITVVGQDGFGKGTLAQAIARALQLPLVELPARECASPETVLSRLDWQLAIDGFAAWSTKGGRLNYPAIVIYVREADGLSEQQLRSLMALRPSHKYLDLAGRELRLTGGALVFGASHPLPGTKAIELVPYSITEVAEIISRGIGRWPLEMRKYLALAGRFNPGFAIERGRQMLEFARDNSAGGRPSEGLVIELMERQWGMDRLGLTAANYDFLSGLINEAAEASDDGNEAVFLERLGLVKRRDSAFTLTQRGMEVLEIWQQSRS
jgi:DNA sulfur modification protein DndE